MMLKCKECGAPMKREDIDLETGLVKTHRGYFMARFFLSTVVMFACALISAGCRKGPGEACQVETNGEQGQCRSALACYKGKCAALEEVKEASREAKEAAVAAENDGNHDEALRLALDYGMTDGWAASFRSSVELLQQFDEQGIAFVEAMDGLRAVNNDSPDPLDEEATAKWKQALDIEKKKAKDAHAKVMDNMSLPAQVFSSCPDNELAARLIKVLEKKPNMMELLIILGYRYQSNGDVDLEFLRKALEEARAE